MSTFRHGALLAPWKFIFIGVLVSIIGTYCSLFFEPNNSPLHDLNNLWWFWLVTASTVGYGDYSPINSLTRIGVAFFGIGGGTALFAIIITKIGASVYEILLKAKKGFLTMHHLEDHIVLLGYHKNKSQLMIEKIFADPYEKRPIVLCAVGIEFNPFEDSKVNFCSGETITDPDMLSRAGIDRASTVIIYCQDDEKSLAASMAVSQRASKNCHVVVYLEAIEQATLLKGNFPHFEVISSTSAEMMVRSMQDPGSSKVHEKLLSSGHGHTQYTIKTPLNLTGKNYLSAMNYLKENFEATLIGIKEDTLVRLNLDANYILNPGTELFVISENRPQLDHLKD